jgi:DUF1680 family protein
VVYCLESNDIQGDAGIEQIALDAKAEFTPEYRAGLLGGVTVLKTKAVVLEEPRRTLISQYGDVTGRTSSPMDVELIPYFSWNNRKEPKMSVWLPLKIR